MHFRLVDPLPASCELQVVRLHWANDRQRPVSHGSARPKVPACGMDPSGMGDGSQAAKRRACAFTPNPEPQVKNTKNRFSYVLVRRLLLQAAPPGGLQPWATTLSSYLAAASQVPPAV